MKPGRIRSSSDYDAADGVFALDSRFGRRNPRDLPAEGVGFVAYSPLGRGFLTGLIQRFEDFAPDDFRHNSPRFQGQNFNLYLEENLGAERVQLTVADLKRIDELIPKGVAKGERYPAATMQLING